MKRLTTKFYLVVLLVSGFWLVIPSQASVRVKDLVNIQGVQETQLIGYGLVVGLDGTGDGRNSLVTNQSVKNMLLRFNIDRFKFLSHFKRRQMLLVR